MSLVVTCEVHGIDPEEYLADVLIRVNTHPMSRIDELLPPRWKQLRDAERAREQNLPVSQLGRSQPETTDARLAVGFAGRIAA